MYYIIDYVPYQKNKESGFKSKESLHLLNFKQNNSGTGNAAFFFEPLFFKQIDEIKKEKSIYQIIVLPGHIKGFSPFQMNVKRYFGKRLEDLGIELLFPGRTREIPKSTQNKFTKDMMEEIETSDYGGIIDKIQNKSVLILDDVSTRGNNMEAHESHISNLVNGNIIITTMVLGKTI
ncbi:hypothetical protein ACTA71_000988 [Dictyostelium dimigraforme]